MTNRAYSSTILAAAANKVLNIDKGHIYEYSCLLFYFNALSLGAGGSFPHWEGGTGVSGTKTKGWGQY